MDVCKDLASQQIIRGSSMEIDDRKGNLPEYPYRGVGITPGIMGELALELFAGQIVRRADILNAVLAEHESRGGASSDANAISQVKKALQDLASRGLVSSTGAYGIWRFAEIEGALDDESELDDDIAVIEDSLPMVVEEWVGSGSELVYVYSFPSLRALAELRGEDVWPLKIGMTRTTTLERILQQLGTSSFEWPVVHLAIRCNDARLIEKSLHSVLTLRGQHLNAVPGSEWFRASPIWVKSFLSAQVGDRLV